MHDQNCHQMFSSQRDEACPPEDGAPPAAPSAQNDGPNKPPAHPAALSKEAKERLARERLPHLNEIERRGEGKHPFRRAEANAAGAFKAREAFCKALNGAVQTRVPVDQMADEDWDRLLATCARNGRRDEARKGYVTREVPMPDGAAGAFVSPPATDEAERSELRAEVRGAVDRLRPRWRNVMHLVLDYGPTDEEGAAMLRMTVRAYKGILARARKALRKDRALARYYAGYARI
jgi:DNA-directed RNA polymerase specialized sigma24 family protein